MLLNEFDVQNFPRSRLIPHLSTGSDDLDPDLARLGSLGFTGCLSVVRFNSISPLKAALLHPGTSPVVITGPLDQSNCGSLSSANPYEAENTHHLSGKRGKELVPSEKWYDGKDGNKNWSGSANLEPSKDMTILEIDR